MLNSIYQKLSLSGRINQASHGKAALLLVYDRQNSNFVRFGMWLDKNLVSFQCCGFDTVKNAKTK